MKGNVLFQNHQSLVSDLHLLIGFVILRTTGFWRFQS